MFSSTSGVQLCGGITGSTYYSDCYELPFGGKFWEKQQSMIKKRAWAAATKYGEEILVSGGSDDDRILETTEIRHEDGSWHYFVVDLPEPTYGHCMVTIDTSKIFLVGGRNADYELLSTVYLLDKTNIGEGWQQKASMKTKRYEHSCSLVYDS